MRFVTIAEKKKTTEERLCKMNLNNEVKGVLQPNLELECFTSYLISIKLFKKIMYASLLKQIVHGTQK